MDLSFKYGEHTSRRPWAPVEHGSWWSSRTGTSSRCSSGTSSASTWSTRGVGPVLSGCSGPHRLGLAPKHSERALGRLRTSRSSTPLGGDHAQSLRRFALPEGWSVRCLFATPSRSYLSSWGHFSRRNSRAGNFLRPSSAIAPVQSGRTFRCALRVECFDKVDTACYSCVPVHSWNAERGWGPHFGFLGRQFAAISGGGHCQLG